MSSAFRRTLPPGPDLEQQKKLAKELLRTHLRPRSFGAGEREDQPAGPAQLPEP
jgi:hypothetical protein